MTFDNALDLIALLTWLGVAGFILWFVSGLGRRKTIINRPPAAVAMCDVIGCENPARQWLGINSGAWHAERCDEHAVTPAVFTEIEKVFRQDQTRREMREGWNS